MLNETIKTVGEVAIVVTGKDGKVKQKYVVPNLIVTAGLSFIASRMKDATATAMSHMALGTGATAAVAGNTALVTEAGRVALDSTTVTANAVEYKATFEAGTGTGAIVEAGLFNANSGGTMLCRTVFAAVNKGVDDSMSITWTITVSAGA